LATGSHDRTVRLWDIQGRKFAEKDATVLPAYDTSVTSLAFSPDGKSLAGGTGDSKVIIWNVITKLESAVIERVNRGLVSCAAFSPDGGLLVTGGTDQTVEFWDAPDGNDLFELKKGWVSP
jgi:WD40 repeat protein